MRGAAAWLELPENPHPTPLRGAAFSHKWEKEGRGPLVRTAGLEPTLPFEKQIFLPLRLSPPPVKRAFVVWTIPSPWPSRL